MVFFKFKTFKTGIEIVLQLSVRENFSSTVHHRMQIVDKDCCSLLRNMLPSINTGMHCIYIVEQFLLNCKTQLIIMYFIVLNATNVSYSQKLGQIFSQYTVF